MTRDDVLKVANGIIKNGWIDTLKTGEFINAKRIHKCQAEYQIFSNCILIQSYKTLVALYNYEDETLYSFGRYTMTTYQHIRKFRNDYTPNMYLTKEENLELVNWFH